MSVIAADRVCEVTRPNITHRIFFKDSRKMNEIPDESVHLVVTSPPYWNIKDYGHDNQIGYRDSLTEYIDNLNIVWAESIRVLHPGCRLCINIGDMYLSATKMTPYQIVPIHAMIVNSIARNHSDSVVYLGSIIWQKISTTNTSGGANVMGSYGRPRNGYLSLDYEYIAIFKKVGDPPKVSKEVVEQSRINIDDWRELFSGHWKFNGISQKGHIAMFPVDLPKRLIKMFTFPGDTVLDPFLGSGTTTKAACEMGRSSIGYEIGFDTKDGEDFKELIRKKVHYYDIQPEMREAVYSFSD
ncbi:MAG: site-specific DNA-methyltransferase [Methanomassiliicoccales archaeon]|nr:site-specific DNA-methyltransferase [Methanomassiliicoccales archaeon]